MDDFVASFDSENDAIAFQKQLQFTLARGKFKLVYWCSNSIRVCDQIDPTLLCKPVEEMLTCLRYAVAHSNQYTSFCAFSEQFEDQFGFNHSKETSQHGFPGV